MPGPPTHGRSALRWIRIVSLILLVTAAAVIATITFWPGPPDPDGQEALHDFLFRAHANGLPAWITFGKIEFSANVVMFIPIGLFGALSLPRFRWLTIPAACAASIGIELYQSARMPERVGTPRDVLANTIGAIIGYLVACLIVALVQRRAARRSTIDRALTQPVAQVSAP